jgi:hypothetical protein
MRGPRDTITPNLHGLVSDAATLAEAPYRRLGGVIHSLGCPVGGRPASPRKSHSKSQRGQASGDTQLRQATVKPGQVPREPFPATSSDAMEVTGSQGVAGSNPAVPTGGHASSNIVTSNKSQRESQLVVQMAFPEARADHVPSRTLTGPQQL